MFFTGRNIYAHEAELIGLVYSVFSVEEFYEKIPPLHIFMQEEGHAITKNQQK
jgi:hypothetical protein